MKNNNGLFIVFEGIDGTGKTTQVRLLKEYLEKNGFEVQTTHEPTKGFYGQKIRELAVNGRDCSVEEEFKLFLLDREEDVQKNVLPSLKLGKIVLMDRYYFSSMAYQGARGLDPQMIRRENEKIAPPPELMIIIEISIEESINRINNYRNEQLDAFEDINLLKISKKIFDELTEPYIVRLNGNKPIAKVQEEIVEVVMNKISNNLAQSCCNCNCGNHNQI